MMWQMKGSNNSGLIMKQQVSSYQAAEERIEKFLSFKISRRKKRKR